MMVAYALWVITVIALMVGQLAGSLHHSIVQEREATEHAELRAAAISGLEAYRFILTETANTQYSHSQEVFRTEPGFCSFRTGNGVRTICFHVMENESDPESRLSIGTLDEESRFNILKGEATTISKIPGVTPQMAANLAAHLETKPAMAPMVLRDLRVIPGWEAVDLAELSRLATLYGAGRVNVNTTTPGVLRLLDVSDRAIGRMMEFLSGPNGVRGDSDDRFFKGLSEIELRLREFGIDAHSLSEWMEAIDEEQLTVLSQYYRIRVRSFSESTGSQYEVDTIVRADSLGVIVAWQEHQPV